MPVIAEEMETNVPDFDLSQLLELPEEAYAPATNVLGEGVTGAASSGLTSHVCPSHPDGNDCLCHGLMGDWDIPPSAEQPGPEPDYAKFEDWIPRFVRPAKPCDYCRSKHLNCYLSLGETRCTPCSSLFRECSLTNSKTLEASNYANSNTGTFFDTLHPVDENAVRDRGTITGVRPLHSRDKRSGTSTPFKDDDPGSSKRNGIRFPRHAVKILREWLDEHQQHPYPTEEQKLELEQQTELKPIQIANWLANARRRNKVMQKPKPRVAMSPSLRPSTPAIDIPEPDKPWDELNPLERWKHSPPENEPATFTDIGRALERNDFPNEATSPSSYETRRQRDSSNGSKSRAHSTTSFETSQASSLSNISSGAKSRESNGSFGSFNSSLAGKKERRRRRRAGPANVRQSSDDKKRIFQCTFCTDTFKSKYDWTRHEKSLHLSLEKWICAPLGPYIADKDTGTKTCVYCGMVDPPSDHGETHNHSACEEKGFDARTFYRKDHLRQHLRLMHGCELAPSMDAWKSVANNVSSRCGFCAQRFTVWQERVDHLTAHFKAGARMAQWKGCRGLDPGVAAQVTNAMPPYLIGIEAVSPNPFSATNRNLSHNFPINYNQKDLTPVRAPGNNSSGPELTPNDPEYGTKATCWEILTVRLGKYANEMAAKNMIITDDMLQAHARRILYGSDDTWNQTAADNPEWLDLFKKAHGLDFIPSVCGGQGAEVPEDLEIYGDLGMRIPFAVQLAAFNQAQVENGVQMANAANTPGEFRSELDKRRQEVRGMYHQLSKEGVLHDPSHQCQHVECEKNVVDARQWAKSPATKPKHKRWCTYELPEEKAKKGPTSTAPVQEGQSLGPTFSPANGGGVRDADTDSRTRALQSLEEMETRNVANSGCPWLEHDMRVSALRAKAETQLPSPQQQGFNTIQRIDCPNHDSSTAADSQRPSPPQKFFDTLQRLECPNSVCPTTADEDATLAIKSRARWALLEKLQDGEVTNCPFIESNSRLGDQRDRQIEAERARAVAQGLRTLTNLEMAEKDDNYGPNGIPVIERTTQGPSGKYLPRHKYELPPDRARLFATTTGAWQDSGSMPASITNPLSISLPSIAQPTTTSTGAMMEFLGGEFGSHLEFANDAATSQIPLQVGESGTVRKRVEQQEGYHYPPLSAENAVQQQQDPHDWYGGTDHWVEESVLMRDLDEMLLASGMGEQSPQQQQQQAGGMNLEATAAGTDINPNLPDLNNNNNNDNMEMPDFNMANTNADVSGMPLEWTDADIAALTAAVAPVNTVPFSTATMAGTEVVQTQGGLGHELQMQVQDLAMPDIGFDDMEFDSVFDFEAAQG